jgi:hypothetical protein
MPTAVSAIALQQLHGAASRVAADATAFPHRYDHLSLYVHPGTDDPAESDKIVRWGRETWAALQPFVEPAVYVNALEEARIVSSKRTEGTTRASRRSRNSSTQPTSFRKTRTSRAPVDAQQK